MAKKSNEPAKRVRKRLGDAAIDRALEQKPLRDKARAVLEANKKNAPKPTKVKKAIKDSMKQVTELRRKKRKSEVGGTRTGRMKHKGKHIEEVSPTGRKPREPVIQNLPIGTPESRKVVQQLKESFLGSVSADTLAALYKFDDGFKPSRLQLTIFDWIVNGEGNAFVEAVAGSGKTTTLLRACKFMEGLVICIAFNAKIAAEFNARIQAMGLASKVKALTCHAAGNRAFKNDTRFQRSVLCKDYEKVDAMLDYLKPEGAEKFPEHLRSAVMRLVSLAKQSGVLIAWELGDMDAWDQLIEHHNVEDLLPENGDPEQLMAAAVEYAKRGILWAKKDLPRRYDFDDMIWGPLVEGCRFDKYDWVLVDEAQDLNTIRRMVAERLLDDGGRLIAVGDRHQAIYGFTGADDDSIDRIIKTFGCTSLPLNVCYRCSKAIVAEAKQFVPQIEAFEEKPEGKKPYDMSREEFEKSMALLSPECAILCRYNRPTVSLAFRLIREGIPCHVEGRSIGDSIANLANKWKVKTTELLAQRLQTYLENETRKAEAQKKESKLEAIRDRVETLQVIMEGCTLVSEVHDKIRNLFKDTDGSNKRTVTLSTVHKAKGREWKVVYILGYRKYMPSPMARQEWQLRQEDNLRYVGQTRAEEELIYLEALDDK